MANRVIKFFGAYYSLTPYAVGVGAIGASLPQFTGTITEDNGDTKRKMSFVEKTAFGGFLSGTVYVGLPVIAVCVGIAAATGKIWRDTDGTYVIGSRNK